MRARPWERHCVENYRQSVEALHPIPAHWRWWEWEWAKVEDLYSKFEKYRLVNRYAKFGSMHEGRFEFVLEGSDDGRIWKKYQFLFKPSTATQIPSIVPLHIPRLDWRTWFLPLYWKRSYGYSSYQPPGWWRELERKFKVNEEGILKVIKYNPFPIQDQSIWGPLCINLNLQIGMDGKVMVMRGFGGSRDRLLCWYRDVGMNLLRWH